MKALVLVVGLLFAGNVVAGEGYLTPPKQSENVVGKVLFTGFLATVTAAVVLGIVAGVKNKPGISTATSNTVVNLYRASMVCDGLAAGLLIGTAFSF